MKDQSKLISDDDHLPKRDIIGERRMNHELRVLAYAGNKSSEYSDNEPSTWDVDGSADMEAENGTELDLESYNEVEAQHKAKLASKSKKYSSHCCLKPMENPWRREASY